MSDQKVWQKVLGQNEEIKYEFSIGKRYTTILGVTLIILGVPMLALAGTGVALIGLGFFLMWYLKKANHYAFTDKRVLIHKGWLSTRLTSVDYNKITDTHIEEPFFSRILTKTGHLAINTAGTTVHEVVLKHIEMPYEVKKKLDEIREKENIN